MIESCLHNWSPAARSSSEMEGASILPNIQMEVYDLAKGARSQADAFRTKEAFVEFLYCLSGGMEIVATSADGVEQRVSIAKGKGYVLYLPDCTGRSIVLPDEATQVVCLRIRPDHFGHLAKLTGCPLHPTLDSIAQGRTTPCFLDSGAIPLPLRVVVQHIVTNTTDNSMRTIFMEYKKIELFYLQLNLLETEVVKLHSAKPQNLKIAYAARDILMRDFANPPGLDELAKQVGLNRSQLNALFRSVFGVTVFGLVRGARLECARKMLEDGNCTVTEVAYECGFSSPSHLTSSFAKEFNTNPKQYQAEFNAKKEAAETAKLKVVVSDIH